MENHSSEPKRNVVAIAYDFDGTLAPGYMQEYDFIPSLQMANEKFWREAEQQSKKYDMDGVLSYMFLMLKKAKEMNVPVKKEDFKRYGSTIRFFEGVEEYFEHINAYAESRGITIEHSIISSGLREFVEGTPIAKHFTNIFASGFVYDETGNACWPALAINYTNKTQFLFRINKGINNAYDNSLINKRIPENEKAIPFENMIYIGDGETDVPAMKMVKLQGGHTITVYNPNTKKSKHGHETPRELCLKLIQEKRADYFAPADYRPDSELMNIVKALIDKIAAELKLKEIRAKNE